MLFGLIKEEICDANSAATAIIWAVTSAGDETAQCTVAAASSVNRDSSLGG